MRKASSFVILLAFFVSCSETKGRKNNPVQLPVTKLKTIDTILFRGYVADIQAVQNVEIRNRVPGYLEKIFLDEGQPVKKGQLLFQIEDKQYREDMARADAALAIAVADSKSAELEIERVKLLVDKNVVTASEMDVAQAKLSSAKAKIREMQSVLNNAQTKLSYTRISAPFEGIINRIPLKVGSLLSDGDLLTTVSDIGAVNCYFNISENEYLNLLKTKRQLNGESNVHLVLANGSMYKYPGRIETVESEFDASTGSIAFRAKFPNPNKMLRHGATGTIQLPMKIDSAIIIPQKSVVEIQDKNYVYVVNDENKLEMKSFVPQLRFSKFVIVKSGLKEGERILYEGIQEARDGVKISPKPVSLDSILIGRL